MYIYNCKILSKISVQFINVYCTKYYNPFVCFFVMLILYRYLAIALDFNGLKNEYKGYKIKGIYEILLKKSVLMVVKTDLKIRS